MNDDKGATTMRMLYIPGMVEDISLANKAELELALSLTVDSVNDFSIDPPKREIYRGFARLLRKQLKQY